MSVAVVTGARRGIGLAIAQRLQAEGHRVVPGNRPALDVTDAAAVAAFFAAVGTVDILVNNAGIAAAAPVQDEATWHRVIDTDLHGPWRCCRAARLAEGGRVVNVASVLGLRGVADQPAYCAAKHGLVGLTRSLALAWAPRGITVNAVCPGWVETDMARARYAELAMTAQEAAAGVPTGRITTAAEVADAVAWLCGPGAASVTGQCIVVDGGRLAAP